MEKKSADWVRCTRANRCPICGRDHYCMVSKDGVTVICTKVESKRVAGRSGGWIHKLPAPIEPPPPIKRPEQKPVSRPEMGRLAAGYRERCEHPELLSNELGVSVESLSRVELGYDGRNWTFPMYGDRRVVIGIKVRPPTGRKFCIPGSKLGITWPLDLTGTGPLLICEGESDTAAALDLGFDTIGRPSCTGSVDICVGFVSRARYKDIWIFADRDEPGIKGAKTLVEHIKPITRRVKILHCPWHKDLRQWLQHGGATRPMIECLASNARFA